MVVDAAGGEVARPQAAPAFDVLYANDSMMVVNKPFDVAMDGAQWPHTVETWATAYMKAHGLHDATHEAMQQQRRRTKQLKFVHQLDYATSGVLCLAFTKDMAARLAHCFEMRTTQKYYVALLHGHVPDWQSDASLREWLRQKWVQENSHDGRDGSVTTTAEAATGNGDGFALVDSVLCTWPDGHVVRHPQCDASVDAAVAGLQASLCTPHKVIAISLPVGYEKPATGGALHPVTKVLLEPKTGRRHQLRVHCNALGFPILGDTVYVTGTSNDWPRMCLHAWLLRLPCAVTASVDEDERVRLKKRRRRETRGLEDAAQNATAQSCWTEFVTADPFPLNE